MMPPHPDITQQTCSLYTGVSNTTREATKTSHKDQGLMAESNPRPQLVLSIFHFPTQEGVRVPLGWGDKRPYKQGCP